MSSDTYLSLREHKDTNGRFYELELCNSEGDVIAAIAPVRNLRQAMIIANTYQHHNDVEYGLLIFPSPRSSLQV